ncbi:amidohydrolase family protein [Williamsia herbipolensis]|uniref:Amidohydrolase family protein n=1 Tax=Williamsia herbipolensis TaxID=1603258 RepID=A0AAU4JYM0_9NOCA|nr:amidohydrolase family protein [Williamsia herbipolensis]
MSILVPDASVYCGGGWDSHRDIVIDDGVVTAIVPAGTGEGVRATAPGGHVIPGFVNTHTHLQQSLMRGVAECTPLLSWLLEVGRRSTAITPERAYLAAVSASLEGLRSGTTTLLEHMWPHPSPDVHDAVIRGLRDTGVRAVVGRGIADRADATRRWGFEPSLMQPLDEVFSHVDQMRQAVAGSTITVGLAVPNPRSLTPDGMAAVRGYAQARSMTVSIHLAETPTDDAMCREHAGVGALDYLATSDFLWDRLLAVHCVEVSAQDRETLRAHGVGVSHNPLSNMRLGSGVAPVPAMLAEGLRVGLGVDGAASNDTQNMLESFRIAAYLQRATHKRADLLGFGEMIDMACGGVNPTMGLPEVVGGVTVGAPADLTVIRFDRDFATLPVSDPGASILTTGSPSIVDTVLVNGEVVIADGHSTRVDESALTAQIAAL